MLELAVLCSTAAAFLVWSRVGDGSEITALPGEVQTVWLIAVLLLEGSTAKGDLGADAAWNMDQDRWPFHHITNVWKHDGNTANELSSRSPVL